MYTVYLFVLLGALIGIKMMWWEDYYDCCNIFQTIALRVGTILWGSILGAFIGLIFGFMAGLLFGMIDGEPPHIVESRIVYRLEAISDDTQSGGSSILGSGRISDRAYYVFYYQDLDGYYKYGQIPASNARISYCDGMPRIEQSFRVDIKQKYRLIDWFKIMTPSDKQYTIYVPRGSIKQQYRFDLRILMRC